MAKISTLLLVSSFFFLAFSSTCAIAKGHNGEKSWREAFCQGKETTTKLHFYLQDVLGGPNATVWEVAKSPISNSATSFGQIRVLDDLITQTPKPNSKKLGRAQGLITFADLDVSALNMNLNFVFTAGRYNGSTLTILGRNQIMNVDRELPVVGGTGIFRMARGYAISNTYSYNVSTNYGILEYTVYVVHTDVSKVKNIQMVMDI
ncbi:hypothetical protein RD792_017789 [Penstemon davidsonii]|uniref:Dirigent protein n=1 Tax=Penstemon davidsonii TaxID=160366 RepID=A0ABR0DVR9_9LAMI|nr:hypothetical protein RD792_017789 [Penstemon davidsonii]